MSDRGHREQAAHDRWLEGAETDDQRAYLEQRWESSMTRAVPRLVDSLQRLGRTLVDQLARHIGPTTGCGHPVVRYGPPQASGWRTVTCQVCGHEDLA